MVALICVAGAVLGLVIALVSRRLVLPIVLRSQDAQFRDGRIDRLPLPAVLRDAQRLRSLTIAAYRYMMPLLFAAAGATAAYYLFVGDAQ